MTAGEEKAAPRFIIFTDLDGTLLHPRTYSFDEALPALDRISERSIPLVFVSSKTRAELEVWRQRLENRHPFISENGGGIFVPDEYFPFQVEGEFRDRLHVISLGMPYGEIRRRFVALRDRIGLAVRGFGDMSIRNAIPGMPKSKAGKLPTESHARMEPAVW